MRFVGDILSAGSASVVRFLEQMSTDDLHALHRGMAALAALITAEARAQRAYHTPSPIGSEA